MELSNMDMMPGLIGFEHLPIKCIIGVYPEERLKEQEIFVDLKVEANFGPCALSDQINHTVNYAMLAKLCTEMAQTSQYQLLETYASHVLQKLIDEFAINWAWIKVKKPMAASSSYYMTVELKQVKERYMAE